MTKLTAHDLYAAMIREFGGADPFDLDMRGYRWVMDRDSYRSVRAAARDAGAIYPPDDDPDPAPDPSDRLFGLLVDVRDGAGAPHIESAR